jgi:hypothetical protein
MKDIPKWQDLITPEYKSILQNTHGQKWVWTGDDQSNRVLCEWINDWVIENNIRSLLNYGAGKSTFASHARSLCGIPKTNNWEPGISGRDNPKVLRPHQMVTCFDVVEHIEPEKIEDTIKFLSHLTTKICFVSIHTHEARKWLYDPTEHFKDKLKCISDPHRDQSNYYVYRDEDWAARKTKKTKDNWNPGYYVNAHLIQEDFHDYWVPLFSKNFDKIETFVQYWHHSRRSKPDLKYYIKATNYPDGIPTLVV